MQVQNVNQTLLVHNMRCQNQLQWGEFKLEKQGIATSHTCKVHTVFTQKWGGKHLKYSAALCGYENI